MKMIGLPALAAFLALSGVALAQQSEDQKERSAKESMSQMMKGRQSHKGNMHGMGDMGGMMQQCAAMMPSVEPDGDRKDKQE